MEKAAKNLAHPWMEPAGNDFPFAQRNALKCNQEENYNIFLLHSCNTLFLYFHLVILTHTLKLLMSICLFTILHLKQGSNVTLEWEVSWD